MTPLRFITPSSRLFAIDDAFRCAVIYRRFIGAALMSFQPAADAFAAAYFAPLFMPYFFFRRIYADDRWR